LCASNFCFGLLESNRRCRMFVRSSRQFLARKTDRQFSSFVLLFFSSRRGLNSKREPGPSVSSDPRIFGRIFGASSKSWGTGKIFFCPAGTLCQDYARAQKMGHGPHSFQGEELEGPSVFGGPFHRPVWFSINQGQPDLPRRGGGRVLQRQIRTPFFLGDRGANKNFAVRIGESGGPD